MAKRLNSELMKRIAIYKSNNPELTYEQIAADFGVQTYQVRYAIEKYAESVKLGKNTKRGLHDQASIAKVDVDDVETLRSQLNMCLSEMQCNDKLALGARIDLLLKSTRIRRYIQTLELENHMKRADAELIANIIRRFRPDITNDEIIKIYTEELAKWKAEGK
jgi:hypothetical protein